MQQKDITMLQALMRKYARMYMKLACEYGVRYDDAEDVVMLYDYGYDEFDIECMLYEPAEMQRCIEELRMMEMC